jgi:hypothetical protein
MIKKSEVGMKKTAVVILVLLAGAMTATAGEVAFVDTYAHAKQMAAEQNKNMLITFFADW